MPVPNQFANVTTSIPLSQLDANFNTPITLGNTAIQLGNTVTTLNNMTLANVTVTSGNVTITNVTVTTANVTTANIATANVTTSQILNYGTANGVAYLNTSKALTTGTTLVFDGTNFGIGGTPGAKLEVIDGNSQVRNSATQTQGTVLSNGLTFRATNQLGQDRGVIAAIKPYFGNGADNDFGLAFQTQATTAGGVTTKSILDPAGNLGLGVTPSAWGSAYRSLDVRSGGGGFAAADEAGLITTNAYYDGTNWKYKITSSGSYGSSLYNQFNGVHSFSSAASGTANANITFTEVLSVQRNETLALQGASRSAGTGITFPATQSASSNANTLDDYEEGTISGSNLGLAYATPGTSSFTYSDRRGTYTKIGRVVYFTIDIRLSAFTKGTASGSLFVVGLPFVQRDTSGFDSARCTVQLYNWTYTTSPIIAAILTNSTSIAIERMVSNAVTTTIDDPNSNSIIWITGFYFV